MNLAGQAPVNPSQWNLIACELHCEAVVNKRPPDLDVRIAPCYRPADL